MNPEKMRFSSGPQQQPKRPEVNKLPDLSPDEIRDIVDDFTEAISPSTGTRLDLSKKNRSARILPREQVVAIIPARPEPSLPPLKDGGRKVIKREHIIEGPPKIISSRNEKPTPQE